MPILALAVATHEDWLEANRYIDMKLLKEHKREPMKETARRRPGMAGLFAEESGHNF